MAKKRRKKTEEELPEETENLEPQEEKPQVKMKYDENGMPKYDYRYVMAVQKPDEPNCYKYEKEGNTLKTLKELADKTAAKVGRKVIVFDRQSFTGENSYEVDPKQE